MDIPYGLGHPIPRLTVAVIAIQSTKYGNLIGWLRATELDYAVKCPKCRSMHACHSSSEKREKREIAANYATVRKLEKMRFTYSSREISLDINAHTVTNQPTRLLTFFPHALSQIRIILYVQGSRMVYTPVGHISTHAWHQADDFGQEKQVVRDVELDHHQLHHEFQFDQHIIRTTLICTTSEHQSIFQHPDLRLTRHVMSPPIHLPRQESQTTLK